MRRDDLVGHPDLTRWRTAFGRWLVRAFRWLDARVGRHWRDGSLSVTALVVAAVGGLLLLGSQWIVAETYEGVLDKDGIGLLDRPVLNAMLQVRSPALDSAVTGFTDLGGTTLGPVTAVLVTAGLWALWRRRTPLVLMGIALAGSLLATLLGKDLTARHRPPQTLAVPPYESSPSFPSGHTLNMTVIMGIAAYVLVVRLHRSWQRVVALVLTAGMAISMGLSRVYLGHHWLTDVVAGWFLGIGWVVTIVTIHRLVVTVRRTRAERREHDDAVV